MLNTAADQLTATSSAGLATGADASVLAANTERNGLYIQADPANSGPVFLLLATTGAASATNYHVALAAGQSWNGKLADVLWRGPVRAFSAAAQRIVIAEA